MEQGTKPKYYYLAYPFGLKKSIRKWQIEFEKQFSKIKLINPFYENKFEKNNLSVAKDKIQTDVKLIKKSNGIIAIVDDKNSIGTHMEIVYAYLFKKPVYTIALTDYVENHPWIYYHSTKIFSTKGELILWLKSRDEKTIKFRPNERFI